MRCPSAFSPASKVNLQSNTVTPRNTPGSVSIIPRAMSLCSIPARFTAVRCPASARLAAFPCTCTPRTRSFRAAGCSSTSCSTAIVPAVNVPVTTLPNPFIANDRSTGSRIDCRDARSATRPANSRSTPRNSSIPSPVRALTPTTGAPSRNDPATNSSTSISTNSINSPSTKSDFVITTTPVRNPNSRQMSKCSLVCGFTDSSAATTSITKSIPVAPATIVFTNRSCPGTSTNPARTPPPNSNGANPSSIEIPRRFSSASLSVSTPVNAAASAVLPWSMCPAVPTIMDFMKALLFSVFSIAAFAQQPTPPPEAAEPVTFRAVVADVRVDVLAFDGPRRIDTLAAEDFLLYDNNAQQIIKSFSRGREPLTLLLLLDVSGSMSKSLDQLAASSKSALAQLTPDDQVGIMLFSRHTRLHTPFTKDLSKISAGLRADLAATDLGSGTQINHALMDAVAYLNEAAPPTGRRAILVLTDNLGINVELPDEKVVAALQNANTVLSAIVTGRSRRNTAPPKFKNPDWTYANVFHLSDETGGDAIQSDKAGEAFPQLIENLRARYSLFYSAPGGQPGEFRKIKVDIHSIARNRHNKITLRYRNGYYVQ